MSTYCVSQGSTVTFRTVHNVQVEGQVISFDPIVKALAIREKDKITGKPTIKIFNLGFINEIKEISPATDDSMKYFLENCEMNAKKNEEKIKTILLARSQEIMPTDDVSIDGQKAFLQLKRTISDTRWDGPNIRVINFVSVKKPYNGESAEILQSTINSESDQIKATSALAQVRKILSKPYVTSDERLRADHSASV